MLKITLHQYLREFPVTHTKVTVFLRYCSQLRNNPFRGTAVILIGRRTTSDRDGQDLKGYHHVDHGIAALSALTAACAISICCAFWIATAWPQGAVATGFVAVICSLFAAMDDPTPTMSTLTAGIVASIPIAALYQFAILPAIDGYVALVVCLAPPLLLFGAVMAIPQYTAFGLAPILGFTVLLAFQPQYTADMPPAPTAGTTLGEQYAYRLHVDRVRGRNRHPLRRLRRSVSNAAGVG